LPIKQEHPEFLAYFDAKFPQEVSLLISSDAHPTILRYFAMERDGDFLYLALEQCACSLTQVKESITACFMNLLADAVVEVFGCKASVRPESGGAGPASHVLLS
jgi:hypothetical protein